MRVRTQDKPQPPRRETQIGKYREDWLSRADSQGRNLSENQCLKPVLG